MTPFAQRRPRAVATKIGIMLGAVGVLASLLVFCGDTYAVDIVDVIVGDWSGESLPNPEPTLAVDSVDPNRIAVTALAIGAGGGRPAFCPIAADATYQESDSGGVLVSTDGGITWSLRCLLPTTSDAYAGNTVLRYFPPLDVTLGFAGKSHALIGAYISPSVPATGRVAIARQVDWIDANAANVTWWNTNAARMDGADQPQLAVMPGGTDAQFVVGAISHQQEECPNGSVLWLHRLGQPDLKCVNNRASERKWSFVRAAIHANGRFYAAVIRAKMVEEDLRYDLVLLKGGVATDGAVSFTNPADAGLEDCGPDEPGGSGNRLLCNAPFLPNACMENNPIGSNEFSLDIDPRNDDHVVLAYGKAANGVNHLYLAETTDGGKTIGAPFFDADSAINPAVAVDGKGRVAVLFQQLFKSDENDELFWTTRVRVYEADRAFSTDVVLASHPTSEPTHSCGYGFPFLGDYVALRAVGETFYGVFSADNNPYWNPRARYLRDPALLVGDAAHPPQVAWSIDPFFFKLKRQGLASRLTSWIGPRKSAFVDDPRIPAAIRKLGDRGPRF